MYDTCTYIPGTSTIFQSFVSNEKSTVSRLGQYDNPDFCKQAVHTTYNVMYIHTYIGSTVRADNNRFPLQFMI